MTLKPRPPEMLTWHAITRFCQRVLDVPEIVDCADPHAEAVAHCEAANLSMETVVGFILEPRIVAAVRLGLDRYKVNDWVAMISRGRIITIRTDRQIVRKFGKPRGKMKHFGNREHKREINRRQRRA